MKVLMLGWELPPHISGGLGTACQGLCEGLAAAEVDVIFVVPRVFGDETAGAARVLGADGVELPAAQAELRAPAADAPAPAPDPEAGVAEPEGPPLRVVRRRLRRRDLQHGVLPDADDLPLTHDPMQQRGPEVEPEDWVEVLEERFADGRVRTVEVDSTLRPYQRPEDHARWWTRDPQGRWVVDADWLADPEHAPFLERAPSAPPPSPEAWFELADAAAATAVHARVTRLRAEGTPGLPRPEPGPGPGPLRFAGGYGGDLLDEVARYALAVAHLAAGESFDLVHAHDWMTYPAGVAAARAAGVPLVAHVHASELDRSGENPDPRVAAIERMGVTHAQRVVAVSHFTAKKVARHYGVPMERIRVLHNAVTRSEQTREWHTERTLEGPLVLYLGRVTMQKGPEYFLAAAAKVVALRPDVQFVLSGSGDMLPRMVEHSARLGLARNLFFTGFLRGKDVERMYAMADLYVMPSVSEPFGITPLEAMALDVPVIVSRQSGVSEVVTHALKVDFWDVDELANKMLAVLTYEPLRRQLVDEGREEVRRLRWDVRGKLLKRYYEEVLS